MTLFAVNSEIPPGFKYRLVGDVATRKMCAIDLEGKMRFGGLHEIVVLDITRKNIYALARDSEDSWHIYTKEGLRVFGSQEGTLDYRHVSTIHDVLKGEFAEVKILDGRYALYDIDGNLSFGGPHHDILRMTELNTLSYIEVKKRNMPIEIFYYDLAGNEFKDYHQLAFWSPLHDLVADYPALTDQLNQTHAIIRDMVKVLVNPDRVKNVVAAFSQSLARVLPKCEHDQMPHCIDSAVARLRNYIKTSHEPFFDWRYAT